MKRIKKWWREFKEDLLFNITMVIMCISLLILFAGLVIIAIKEVWGVC